jgi:hypothetical protein
VPSRADEAVFAFDRPLPPFNCPQLADRAYVLETGRVTLSGGGRELADNPEVKRAYLGG